MIPAESVVNATEADPPKTPLETLRERTRELHARLETTVDMGAALGSVSSYTRLLGGYLNIYTSFERELQRQDAQVQAFVSQNYQSKIPSLQRDLHALGAARTHHSGTPISLPELHELDSVLGALYVVEGSALGGQYIYREIQQKLGLDQNSGAAFFFGNGEQTGSAWKRFTAVLNARISQPEQAADAAVAMFRAFECGLRPTGDDSTV